MTLTSKEYWTALHGMVLGAGFLLAFSGSAISLWTLRAEWTTSAGSAANQRHLILGSWAMALLAWLTVLVGTFIVYPWYRATPPVGTEPSALVAYPKYRLTASPDTADWHTFGMEWKEHIGWLAPILATAVAVVATRNRRTLATQPRLRQIMLMLLTISFFCAVVAGLFGAFINKFAPVR
ncbi:MAG TPA: hypothetical protein VFE58_04065 [Tepidisphaeraceae bacterium]|jgi:hypothetical protein|nr:hypothetical protein [Tepidisphaeraceae bacterium]